MVHVSGVDAPARSRGAVSLRPELLGMLHPGALGFCQMSKIFA